MTVIHAARAYNACVYFNAKKGASLRCHMFMLRRLERNVNGWQWIKVINEA